MTLRRIVAELNVIFINLLSIFSAKSKIAFLVN